jgi:hypothetical protein
MNEISRELRLEGPGIRAHREDRGVALDYLGVRVIITLRARTPRDKGVMVMLQTEDGEEEVIEIEVRGGVTHMPEMFDTVVVATS